MANPRANSSGLLFNPNTYDPPHFDPETRRQLRALIDWFESRGKLDQVGEGAYLLELASTTPSG